MSGPAQPIDIGRRLLSAGGDLIAGVSVVASILQVLPAIAAFFAIVWYAIQISESRRWRQICALIRRKHSGRWRKR